MVRDYTCQLPAVSGRSSVFVELWSPPKRRTIIFPTRRRSELDEGNARINEQSSLVNYRFRDDPILGLLLRGRGREEKAILRSAIRKDETKSGRRIRAIIVTFILVLADL